MCVYVTGAGGLRRRLRRGGGGRRRRGRGRGRRARRQAAAPGVVPHPPRVSRNITREPPASLRCARVPVNHGTCRKINFTVRCGTYICPRCDSVTLQKSALSRHFSVTEQFHSDSRLLSVGCEDSGLEATALLRVRPVHGAIWMLVSRIRYCDFQVLSSHYHCHPNYSISLASPIPRPRHDFQLWLHLNSTQSVVYTCFRQSTARQ